MKKFRAKHFENSDFYDSTLVKYYYNQALHEVHIELNYNADDIADMLSKKVDTHFRGYVFERRIYIFSGVTNYVRKGVLLNSELANDFNFYNSKKTICIDSMVIKKINKVKISFLDSFGKSQFNFKYAQGEIKFVND